VLFKKKLDNCKLKKKETLSVIHNLRSPSVIKLKTERKTRWTVHVAGMEQEKTAWSPFCGKLKVGNSHVEIFTVGGNTILKRILQT
jgi:hypothetical protein